MGFLASRATWHAKIAVNNFVTAMSIMAILNRFQAPRFTSSDAIGVGCTKTLVLPIFLAAATKCLVSLPQ